MKDVLNTYKTFTTKYLNRVEKLNQQSNWISGFRLLSVIILIIALYVYFRFHMALFLLVAGISLVSFLVLIRVHAKLIQKLRFNEVMAAINQREINYLTARELPFENGKEFEEEQHFYTADLDVFENNGLFQHLNRTSLYAGKKILAKKLKSSLTTNEIERNQKAITELAEKIEWRQEFSAHGELINDDASSYKQSIKWSKSTSERLGKFINVLSVVLPIITIALLIVFIVTKDVQFRTYLTYFIIANLFLLARHVKWITKELDSVGHQHQALKKYGLLFELIEQEEFKSALLMDFKHQLEQGGSTASQQIKRLAKYLNDLESMQNIFGAIVFNGLVLYHIHSFRKLLKWKAENAHKIENWLNVVGELDALISLANFSFNNPDYTFPSINDQSKIAFKELGHPLINKEVRVHNSIDFSDKSFVILTGSNMSGKSTFLRTLGVNLILAGAGSAVCAEEANLHPIPILVSMRLADSLSDNESYFFAEVKRLKAIMARLEEEQCFVLLDEILRGTNSDDKRAGTKAVIRSMVEKKAIGMIATHDLEVCSVANEFPEVLSNKRFEVEIVDDELYFDYKLKDGICQNKNATFIMKKMGVIE